MIVTTWALGYHAKASPKLVMARKCKADALMRWTMRTVIALTGQIIFGIAPTDAVPLPPGSMVSIPGTSKAWDPTLEGTPVAAAIVNWSDGQGNVGSVEEIVQRSELLGTLDFYFRVSNLLESHSPIVALRTSDFGGSEPDVNFLVEIAGNAPDAVFGPVGAGVSEGVNFLFNFEPIFPGQESVMFFIRTNAQAFTDDGSADLLISPFGNQFNSHLTSLFGAFEPVVGVPEPTTIMFFIGGLLAAGWNHGHRKK